MNHMEHTIIKKEHKGTPETQESRREAWSHISKRQASRKGRRRRKMKEGEKKAKNCGEERQRVGRSTVYC